MKEYVFFMEKCSVASSLADLFLAGNDDYKTFSSVYLRKVQTRCLKSFLIECISKLRRDEKKGEKGSGKTVKCETKRAGRGNAKHLRSRGPQAGPKAIPHLRSGLWQCNHLWLNLGRPRSQPGKKL